MVDSMLLIVGVVPTTTRQRSNNESIYEVITNVVALPVIILYGRPNTGSRYLTVVVTSFLGYSKIAFKLSMPVSTGLGIAVTLICITLFSLRIKPAEPPHPPARLTL